MSGQLFDKYGAILVEDVVVLETCLREAIYDANGERPVRVVEIGMHDGGTARGIERFLNERGAGLSYVGVDPDDGTTRPRYVPAGGRTIIGATAEVSHEVEAPFNGGLDLVWVDDCHCVNHVVLDTVHYAPLVRIGGFMLFHDVNPRGQGFDHQYHGPEIPEFGLAIDAAHARIRWPFPNWSMVLEKWPDDVRNCGTRAYRRHAQ